MLIIALFVCWHDRAIEFYIGLRRRNIYIKFNYYHYVATRYEIKSECLSNTCAHRVMISFRGRRGSSFRVKKKKKTLNTKHIKQSTRVIGIMLPDSRSVRYYNYECTHTEIKIFYIYTPIFVPIYTPIRTRVQRHKTYYIFEFST